MKQVWVNLATCSATRALTRGAALPTETTAMPEPKSISELRSASTITPPPASMPNTGFVARNMLGHKTDHRSSGSTAKAEVAIRKGLGVYGGDPDTGED